ncbi:MAG: Cytosol aminopeptidase [Paracidovorax wautersii]|uniref:Probable cytosol aminopeptidase n=1 Tax=Paracidovorax wautersii TaxID=1177982 RepID=A0A7V8FQ31_9BURK|nr:MAG: Cytosol aminopeptidase [Paracidovorax wautersii]
MDFALKTADLAAAAHEKTDALVVLVPEGFKPKGKEGLAGLIAQAQAAGDFEGKAGQSLHLYGAAGIAARRLVFAGVGDGSARAAAAAVRAALAAFKDAPVSRAAIALAAPLAASDDDWVRTVVQAAADAAYVYTFTKPKARARRLARVTLLTPTTGGKQGLAQGQALALGVELAREWGNRPGNHATPTLLAGAARALAKLPKVQVEVLGPKEVAALDMGSFIAVAKGSSEPLRFIVLRYNGAAKSVAPHVLVGKGITFDTGGISIKPAGEMDEMKFDMCGAASVLGTFRALAEYKPAINVVGLIPSCENMPDGSAVKPGDVVTSLSGQTIEILNTDAEGRLVLCDALTYAERFKPQSVVDIATLTGACVIALGHHRSGLFSPDEQLATDLLAAGEQAGDLAWRLPLDDDYADALKTHFADVANVGGRAGGSVTAAKFLQRFASAYRWAHLDIAGTAWKSGAAKGATGRPVGLLFQYLLNQVQNTQAPGRGARAGKPPARRAAARRTAPAAE